MLIYYNIVMLLLFKIEIGENCYIEITKSVIVGWFCDGHCTFKEGTAFPSPICCKTLSQSSFGPRFLQQPFLYTCVHIRTKYLNDNFSGAV